MWKYSPIPGRVENSNMVCLIRSSKRYACFFFNTHVVLYWCNGKRARTLSLLTNCNNSAYTRACITPRSQITSCCTSAKILLHVEIEAGRLTLQRNLIVIHLLLAFIYARGLVSKGMVIVASACKFCTKPLCNWHYVILLVCVY